jgi:hypothetical protein
LSRIEYETDAGDPSLREKRLYKVAPVTNNLVTSFIATKVLGMPRSY